MSVAKEPVQFYQEGLIDFRVERERPVPAQCVGRMHGLRWEILW